MSAYTKTYARIVELLKLDSGLMDAVSNRVYEGVAPMGVDHPLILIQPYASSDMKKLGQDRGASRVEVMIRVVSANDSSLAKIEPIYDALDNVLIHAPAERTERGWVIAIERIREVESVDYNSNGDLFRYLGGVYRVLVS